MINFVTRLKSLVEKGNFLNMSEAVKHQFISSCGSKKFRQKLLREKEITLEKCIEIVRNSEMAKIQAAEMAYRLSVKEKTQSINAAKTVDFYKYKRKENQSNYSS